MLLLLLIRSYRFSSSILSFFLLRLLAVAFPERISLKRLTLTEGAGHSADTYTLPWPFFELFSRNFSKFQDFSECIV